MNLRQKYLHTIRKNCIKSNSERDLAFWRDQLFAGTIIYMLPFCFIALIPGVYFTVKTGLYGIAIIDIICVLVLILIGFAPRISVSFRKNIFVIFLYFLSGSLLYYVGLKGTSFIYLLATCIFSILIFPKKYAFRSAWVNVLFCFVYTIIIYKNILNNPNHPLIGLDEWITIITNHIFLCFLFAGLIPQLFTGMQHTIDQEQKLIKKLAQQQKSLEATLELVEEKNNELQQFAYVASHDLREPLRMITNFMGMLKSRYGYSLDEKANTYIDFAVDGGQRMQNLIADLLLLSRTGNKHSPPLEIDLNKSVLNVLRNIHPLFIENNVVFAIKNEELPTIVAYESDLERILQNIFVNAIKFRRKDVPPKIDFEVISNSDEWEFSIQDNGIGIPASQFETIFNIFAKLHSHEDYQGSGIGLAICKKIAEKHGGKIWVESTEGCGSKFMFIIKK